ncbi:NAD(P)-binding protein [Ophiobolus disseminans]|uniref:NAD(P)-binding protein n=1 Tax=Ophiobolus disseminans TaxID=1469910 RepID=A0A6A6ZQH1_9PLEO|nr:NAD(P)-binding protein [Ophiobolus disseminans]
MQIKTIAILGPGGNVGSAIISELIKDGLRFKITAITRPSSTYATPPDSTITHKAVDYASFASLKETFTGQDAVVNCITGGATQYDPTKLIIDAAVAAGVGFYFANEFVSYLDSEQYRRLPEAFVGGKVRIRKYLAGLADQGEMTWSSLNGGPFFDMWLAKGPAGIDIANRRARIYGTGNNPLFWTPLPTMGLAAANMLRNPDLIANRPIYICPIAQLSQNTLLATVERVLGKKFEVEHVDVKKINEHGRIALERGEAGKAMKGLGVSNQFYEGDSGNDFSHLLENEVVGVEMVGVEDAVREVIERYGEDVKIVEGMYYVEACEI